jgi:signal transduction histidine kinase
VEHNEPELKRSGVELQLHVRPIPVTPVPRGAVLTVLSKLVSNAVESMPKGGMLRIELGLSGDRVELKLSDTGAGISPENMERIFEPFFSTKKASTTEVGRNPGLGLAVVHGILLDIGGEITVDSTLGKGTTFSVFLGPS